MNVFILGLRVTSEALEDDKGIVNVLCESLPSSEKRVATKTQLSMPKDHYVGKLLKGLKEQDNVLALGPTRATVDGVLQMQPILIVNQENWEDLLAVNLFVATGGLGPKTEETQLDDVTVTNRSLAWQNEEGETNWFKLTAWDKLSSQLAELSPGTPTIAVGRVSTSEKEDKRYINYGVDKVLYLPKGTRTAPKKAADPDKGRVSTAALGSLDFQF